MAVAPRELPTSVRQQVYLLWKEQGEIGMLKQADIARQVNRSRARIGQLVAEFRRKRL